MNTPKALWLLALLCCAPICVEAQYNVQGKVLDAENEKAIELATVRMLRAADSLFVNGAVTDYAGRYSFTRVTKGDYLLEFKFLGYKTRFVSVTVRNRSQILKSVLLEEDTQLLDAAVVSGTAAQMIVRGDTIEYNASAFKLQEDAVVEDLLKRLPGFLIDSDGNITVNGETIARIRVDGKKFFDGDNEMVTKNFTVDMIDKIQVIDELSEMAQLTGIEDGETTRILNITLKPDRRKGRFGNIGGGIGADFDQGLGAYFKKDYDWSRFLADDARFDANVSVNFFKENSRTTLVGGANNTNNSRSSRGRGNRGWSQGSGITTSFNAGVNNNTDLLNDSLSLGGHLSYNHSSNEGWTSQRRESYLKDVTSVDSSFQRSNSQSNNASLSGEVRWLMDEYNTLVIQPNVTYGYNSTRSTRTFEYFTDGEASSWGNSANENGSQNLNARLSVMYSHKSAEKKGRNLTFSLNGGLTFSDGDGFNVSNKYMPGDSADLRNQHNVNNSSSYNLSLRGSLVEPLGESLKHFLQAQASVSFSKRSSVRDQYDFNELTQAYDLYNEEYSNDFRNTNLSENFSLSYNYRTTAVNLTAGFNGEPAQQWSYTHYADGDRRDIINKTFNYSPTFNLLWNLNGQKRNYIRVEYRGRSTEPTVSQMQPVKNNTNTMHETVGNPSLLPSFAHTLRLQYTKSNQETFSSINAGINGTLTTDAMVSNSIYDASGKQYNQTVNAERNPFNLSANLMYNRPIVRNRLHFNTNTQVSYQQRIGYSSRNVSLEDIDADDIIDGKLMLGDCSLTDNYSVSEDLQLTFTHNVIEVGARGNIRYSNTLNNLNTDRDRHTVNWSVRGNVTLHLPYDWTVDNVLSYSDRTGYADFDSDELMWNATVSKPVFKKKFTLKLTANDILRQRKNINQNIGDNSVSYTQSDMLSSYFVVSLTWRMRRFGGRPDGQRGRRGEMQEPPQDGDAPQGEGRPQEGGQGPGASEGRQSAGGPEGGQGNGPGAMNGGPGGMNGGPGGMGGGFSGGGPGGGGSGGGMP